MKLKMTILLVCMIQMMQAQDSINTLSQQQVMNLVKQFHPVAKQADIKVEKAKADITIAKGLFDPIASARIGNKTFDGIEYYEYAQQELSIPAWYGIELKAGLENLIGSRTDPQETIGKTSYAGITINLAKNLVMDKRRAALQQSKIFKQLSEVEKRTALNDLIREAMKAFWNWVLQYQIKKVVSDAVIVNEKRFELVKISFRQGERSAIDTIEALTQLQSFHYMLNDARLNLQNAGLELSAFLWQQNDIPVMLPQTVTPDVKWKQQSITSLSIPVLDEMLNIARNNHPDLAQYNYKMEVLEVEKKLKFQELLPTINFQYNQLGKGYDFLNTMKAPLFENNFQYGLNIGIPLRLSQGRGEYRKAKLNIQETKLQRNQKTLSVENKIRAYHNELLTLQNQVGLQQKQYTNYFTLQRGEETRFLNGESSLFLVNTRENKTLEALQKLAELEVKYFDTLISLQWASGYLVN